MEKDTMITLDDNTNYILLDETVINEKKYFFAVKYDETTGNPTTDYEVFEEEIEDGESYMITLEDDALKQAILIDFTNNYMHMVGDLVEESEKTSN